MSRLLLCISVLGAVSACGMESRPHYNREHSSNYQHSYTYDDRGYWSPEGTSYRTSTVPEGRWMYERGRNQRN